MKNNFVPFIPFVVGFFVGALTGSTFTLLNAPQSGKKTRAQIREGLDEARDRTIEAISDAQTRTLEKVDEVKNLVEEIGNETKKKSEKLLKS